LLPANLPCTPEASPSNRLLLCVLEAKAQNALREDGVQRQLEEETAASF